MALHFRDFVPAREQWGLLESTYTSLEQLVADANAWIAAEHIRVLNVETVTLPNLVEPTDSARTKIIAGGQLLTDGWYQVVRVWYTTDSA